MKNRDLKVFLEKQYARFHNPGYLRLDPLICLRGFASKRDVELAGLVAAALSYGRVETIIRNVSEVFRRTGRRIARFASRTTLEKKIALFRGFRHRFNDGIDIALLLHSAGGLQAGYGSLESLFIEGLARGDGKIRNALAHFTSKISARALRLAPGRRRSIAFLLPSPQSGSACKRLNMYLRWMVRPDDGIDFGIWERVRPFMLIIPVDTHVAAIARRMGLTERTTADWKMAEEITSRLRDCDAGDPVRYDFSLCRAGMAAARRRAA
jgi:uncharacterized protein (TIGR02757 family)